MSKRKSGEGTGGEAKRKAPDSNNPNQEFVAVLNQLSEYEKNVSRNLFKSKAYKKAAHTLAGLDYKVTNGTEAMKLPGIGKQIGKKLDEFIATGKLNKLDKIEGDETSQAISLLTRVHGVGPVAARNFVEQGVKSIADLEKIQDTLSHAQKIGLKYFKDFEERIPRADIDTYKIALDKSLARWDKKLRFQICGSYRREKSSSFDVDILLSHPGFVSSMKNPPGETKLKGVVEHLESEDLLSDTLSLGPVKFMGVGVVAGKPRRVDIRLVPHDTYWCGVLYFTGSDVFNQEMRAHAQSAGFILNEYSIRPLGELGEPGEALEVGSEEDIFDYLGLSFQAPATRTSLNLPP